MHTKKSTKLFVFAVMLVFSVSLPAADLETEARQIEGKLMAPCCMANTLAEHHSAPALEMRREIREMLRAGLNENRIIEHYVAIHGEQIRAMPVARGFNLVAWLLPPVLLLLASGFLMLLIRRWNVATPEDPPAAAPRPIDPKYAERLRADLAKLD